jgi:hypothetical protein
MGLFSWKCNKCGRSLKNPGFCTVDYPVDESEVTLLLPTGKHISGTYDGYGSIITEDGREVDMYVITQLIGDIDSYFMLHEDEHERLRGAGISQECNSIGEPEDNGTLIKVYHTECLPPGATYDNSNHSEHAPDQGGLVEIGDDG